MMSWVRWHALIFVGAFLFRVSLVAATVGLDAPPDGPAVPDQLDYEIIAYNLSAGHGYAVHPGRPTASRAPGTAFVLAPVYALFGRDFLAARLWFCLLSAATVPLTGAAAHRALSPRLGVVAALWLALYPGHAYYALHFLSEMPSTLFLAAALALQLDALRKPPGWRDAVAGLALGAGLLARPSLAVMAVASGVAALLAGGLTVRQRFVKAALLTAGACLVVGPWVARNHFVMGKATVATIVGGSTYWGANNRRVYEEPDVIGYWISTAPLVDADHPIPPATDEVGRDAAAWRYGAEYQREHLDQLPIVMLHRFGRVVLAYSESSNRVVDLGFRVSWLLSLPFVLIGVVSVLRRTPLEGLVLSGPLLAVAVTTATFYGCARFRDGAAPALAVFAAAGAGALLPRLR